MIVFLSILVAVLAFGMVWFKGMYSDQLRITKYLGDDNNLLRNMVSLKDCDLATLRKELLDTKAELELYKNHESETAKVFKPLGKKVAVSTDGAGIGEAAYFEVKGLDRELINDPQNIRYAFVYNGNRYLGYHVVYGELKAHPLDCEVFTEAGENVETFLEF